ncbi:MAG: SCP2 sterol-binding domain-containing protein [Promethearchaeota archaeon]
MESSGETLRHARAVAEKKLDPIQGLMVGKFKLKGDMAMVMRYTKAAVEMVNCIMNVPNTEL